MQGRPYQPLNLHLYRFLQAQKTIGEYIWATQIKMHMWKIWVHLISKTNRYGCTFTYDQKEISQETA